MTKRKLLHALLSSGTVRLLPKNLRLSALPGEPLEKTFAPGHVKEGHIRSGDVDPGAQADEFRSAYNYNQMNFDDPVGYGLLKGDDCELDKKTGTMGNVLSTLQRPSTSRTHPISGRSAWRPRDCGRRQELGPRSSLRNPFGQRSGIRKKLNDEVQT